MKKGLPNSREIERKFLLKRLPEELKRSRRYVIAQGYLATEPAGRQVRLRKKGKTASLTFKMGRGAAGKNARSSSVLNNSPHSGPRPRAEDCASCATKFRGEIY